MRIKRCFALFLVFALLAGLACAETPVKPRRITVETASPEAAQLAQTPEPRIEAEPDSPIPAETPAGPDDAAGPVPETEAAAPAEAERDAVRPRHGEHGHGHAHPPLLTEETAGSARTFAGSICYDRNGAQTRYDLRVTLESRPAGNGAVEISASPSTGEGTTVLLSFEASPFSFLEMTDAAASDAAAETPRKVLWGTLDIADAASGAMFSRHTFALRADGVLSICDVFGNTQLETRLFQQPSLLREADDALPCILRLGNAYALLFERIAEQKPGETLTLSLRECALPLAQAMCSPRADAFVEGIGLDRAAFARALMNLPGTIAITPGKDDLRFVYRTDANPQNASWQYDFLLDDSGLHGVVYEAAGGDAEPVAIGRVEATLQNGLCVRVDDDRSGGYLYFDAHCDDCDVLGMNAGAQFSCYAALAFDLAGGGESRHVLFDCAKTPLTSEANAMEYEASLRFVDGEDMTSWSLNLTETLS
ncbi:MAG TPA: hypothetical protein IAA75_04220 [Candidatus Pullichristensenella avicola]|nr:hypothetical protein [Candidatus Pullichristensenella avicola]